MPQKDKEQNNRDRKKTKKDKVNNIYSSKHIRMIEEKMNKNTNNFGDNQKKK